MAIEVRWRAPAGLQIPGWSRVYLSDLECQEPQRCQDAVLMEHSIPRERAEHNKTWVPARWLERQELGMERGQVRVQVQNSA